MSADDAVWIIQSGMNVFVHGAAATPTPLIEALARRTDLREPREVGVAQHEADVGVGHEEALVVVAHDGEGMAAVARRARPQRPGPRSGG